MTLVEALTASPTWRLAGWTMLHFLWVGGLIGVALGLLRCALRAASSELRYGVAVLGLASLALSPAIIAWNLTSTSGRNSKPSRRADPAAALTLPNDFVLPPSAEAEDSITSAVQVPERADSDSPLPAPVHFPPQAHESTSRIWSLESLAKVLPALWLGGAPSTFLFLAFGVAGAQRLRRQTILISRGELLERFQRLANEMGIRRTVRLGTLDRLNGPILIGIARPLIVLPASVLLGWSPDLVEMALLHELAHVRRHDNFINLIQCIIEALLFFHPVVWWVSRWARLERELCCDDLVIARTGQPRRYAELLAALALPDSQLRNGLESSLSASMAAPPIVERIRHIVIRKENSMRSSPLFLALTGACFVAPAILIASQNRSTDQKTPAADSSQEQPTANNLKHQQTPVDPRMESVYQRVLRGADVFKGMQARAYTYQRVAAAKAKAGDREGAKRDFERAVALAEQVTLEESNYLPHILYWIASTQVNLDFRTEAIENLKKLTDLSLSPSTKERDRFHLFMSLAYLQAKLADETGLRKTLQLTRHFCDPEKHPPLYLSSSHHILSVFKHAKVLGDGLSLLKDPKHYQKLDEHETRARRSEILHALLGSVEQGCDDEASIEAIFQEARRTIASGRQNQVEDGVIHTIEEINILSSLGKALARLGRFEEALKIARSMVGPAPGPNGRLTDLADYVSRKKIDLLILVGKKQLAMDRTADSLQVSKDVIHIIDKLQNHEQHAYPMKRALTIMAEAGEPTQAVEHSSKLEPMTRSRALIEMAPLLEERGKSSSARAVREGVLKILQSQIDNFKPKSQAEHELQSPNHNWHLQEFGLIQEHLGNSKQALANIQRINDPGQKREALGKLAAVRARHNDLDGALEAAELVRTPLAQAEALEQVLYNLPRRKSR